MAETPSTMLALGTPLPSFALPDLTGKTILSDDFRSAPALLTAFICPYVRHTRSAFVQFVSEYAARGLKVVAINANDAQQFPDDGPEGMKQEAREVGYTFPYLYDEAQDVTKAFHAACTPDLFLYGRDGTLAYRGQFDGSRPGTDMPVTGNDLRTAADAVLAGQPVASTQTPSIGCNIQWKPDKAPASPSYAEGPKTGWSDPSRAVLGRAGLLK